jgi:hypothetical protein
MRKGIVVDVTAADRARLEAVVTDRNSRQKHVWRARIVSTMTEYRYDRGLVARISSGASPGASIL